MSVEFNEEQVVSTRPRRPEQEGMLPGLVMKLHLAKTKEGAEKVLLIAGLLLLGLTLFLFYDLGRPAPAPSAVPGAQFAQ